MAGFVRSIIRASSFFRKEISDILRQPRLILILVFGPFIILFLFGIGYKNQAQPLRVWFVAQPGSTLAKNLPDYSKALGTHLVYSGLSSDQNEALNKLRQGQVDLVIAEPPHAYDTVLSNQQAVFTLYYNEIDPSQVGYITYIGIVFVDVVNQNVLQAIVSNTQQDSVTLHNDMQLAHQNAAALRQATQTGDESSAQQNQQVLNVALSDISMGVQASLGLLSNVQQTTAEDGGSTLHMQNTLTDLKQNSDKLNDKATPKDQRLTAIDKIDKDLSDLDNNLTTFRSLSPGIITTPFRIETKSVATTQPSESDYFAPAVLALLLQHMALTIAALSIVRERNAGAMELFHVSPLSAAEALLGKYVSYMVFGVVIAAALSSLLVFVLHIPMLGSWYYFALVILALLFTSLGIGFVISLVSQTDSQAVQYSMISLLSSVFFSGFFISLSYLQYPVKIISWVLPSTYASIMLWNITLRGIEPNWQVFAGLLAFGLVLMLVAWLLMRRLISSGQRSLQ